MVRCSRKAAEPEYAGRAFYVGSPGRTGMGLEAPSGRGFIDLSGTIRDDQDRVARSRFEIPTEGAGILDLAAAWTLRSGLQFRLQARNLTDEAYTNHLNAKNPFDGRRFLEPGRSLVVGISFHGRQR